jgi:glycosyltransferase involved in cell wall biosynthesis
MTSTICISSQEYPPRVGGVGVAAQRLARHLVAAGYRVHVVTPFDGPDGDGRVERTDENGVITHRLYDDFATNPNAGFAFRKLIAELDDDVGFDLFHGFFLTAVYPCVSVAARHSRVRPVIASIRGSDALTLLDQPYLRASMIPALRKATWITSVNQLYLDRVGEEVDVRGRSSVIRNGIVAPAESAPWQPADANRGVVGTVGQFRRVKDIPLLVRGYAATSRELRSRLLLAGYFDDREEETWTETLIDELGLRGEVEIAGRFANADVGLLLRRMNVYVQSSAYEGLPNALLEAASAGVPLIATAVGGMAEVISDGENGLLVPHGEPAKLAAAITRVLADDAFALRLSAGARRLAAELSPERERDAWLTLYARLLG